MLLMLIFCIDGIIALFQTVDQLIHLICRRLSIVVQADDKISVAMAKPRHKCRMLSEVPCKINSFYITFFSAQPADYFKGIIRRAIVNQKNIIFILLQRFHFFFDFGHYMQKRML